MATVEYSLIGEVIVAEKRGGTRKLGACDGGVLACGVFVARAR